MGVMKGVGAAGPSEAAVDMLRARTHSLDRQVIRGNKAEKDAAAQAAAAAKPAKGAKPVTTPWGMRDPETGNWTSKP